MTTTGFLHLSSDLRNRIYRFAATDADTAIEEHLSQRTSTTSVADTTFFKTRGFLGLTQTCRRIRSEFLPKYLKGRPVSVHIRDAEEYLDTFVSPNSIKGSENIGWLSIRTDEEREDDYPRRLRPLLQQLLDAPNLQFRFMLGDGPSPFNNYFLIHHAEWKTALENDIKTVDVKEPTIWGSRIVLNSASKMPWVKRSLRALVRLPHMGDEALVFFETLGLPLDNEMIFVRKGTSSNLRPHYKYKSSTSRPKRTALDKMRLAANDAANSTTNLAGNDDGSLHSKRPLLNTDSRTMSVTTSVSHSTIGRAP